MPRHSDYSTDLAERICERIADGESIREIIKAGGCPSYTTLCAWLRERPEFAEMYALAKANQAEFGAAEIRELADQLPEYVTITTGEDRTETRVDTGWVQWQKNRIEARKWIAAKLLPRVYGERSAVTVDATVKPEKLISDEAAIAEIAELSQALGLKYQLVEIVDEEGE